MCGITGWIDWQKDLSQQYPILTKMTRTLTKRGPDAEGFWLSSRAALGHRRLVVVDPEGGSQPMIKKRGNNTYVIVYNGELYNTPELRRELQSCGYAFNGHSDTEVLLTAYMEWGPECVVRLNGIYAFGVWNDSDQTFFLARDRMGVKPLFYVEQNDSLLFGSEIKSLLSHPDIPAELDSEGLAEVFVLGPGRTPGSGVFRAIKELKPGFCLLFNRNGTHIRQYWNLYSKPHEDDLETTTRRIGELVQDAIERQLVSDVPVCCFLSGGLDSSAITAVAARHYKEAGKGTLHTYSIDYEGNDRYFKPTAFQPNSDSDWVSYVSEYFGTCHHNIAINSVELSEALDAAVVARDLPGMADIDSSLYLFCREVKKNATVALSGECADEIFGGYPWYHSPEALNTNNFPWSREIDTKMAVFSPELIEAVKPCEYIHRRYQETIAQVPRLSGEDSFEARRREMFYLNFNWFMQTLLDRKDRMSMATGLEVRVPFCDHRIVEYAWNVPWTMKMCEGREKGLLRRALRGILPEDVLYRKKSPYPKTHNPQYLKLVRDRLLEIIHDSSSPLQTLINKKVLLEMTDSGGDIFNRPWYGQLMTGPQLFAFLIQADIWMKKYNISIVA